VNGSVRRCSGRSGDCQAPQQQGRRPWRRRRRWHGRHVQPRTRLPPPTAPPLQGYSCRSPDAIASQRPAWPPPASPQAAETRIARSLSVVVAAATAMAIVARSTAAGVWATAATVRARARALCCEHAARPATAAVRARAHARAPGREHAPRPATVVRARARPHAHPDPPPPHPEARELTDQALLHGQAGRSSVHLRHRE